MAASIVHRVQKVFAEERRRQCGARVVTAKPKPAPKASAADDLQLDLDALEQAAKAKESDQPSKRTTPTS